MKKITKKTFLDSFTPNMKEIHEQDGVKQLDESEIIELNSGKNFFYTVRHDSYLNSIQNNIIKLFLDDIPLNNACVAFRKGYSYFDFLEPHLGSYNFIRLDIKSFFHSIPYKKLKEVFSHYFEDEHLDIFERQKLVDSFLNLVTIRVGKSSRNIKFQDKRILPIGFKTSPAISNIFFRELDILIQKTCIEKGISYTRYADDMLFSSNKTNNFIFSESFTKDISVLISKFDFKLNNHKTIKSKHTISLNGYTISSNTIKDNKPSIRISNKKTKIIEKIIQKVRMNKSPEDILYKLYGFRRNSTYFKILPVKDSFVKAYCKDQLHNKVIGYRSYLLAAIKFNINHDCITKTSIEKYLNMINELEKIITNSPK